MSNKSHVGLGVHVCPVCFKEHDEVVLLHRRLAKTLEHKNFIGFEMCPEHQEKFNEGYVALVEVRNDTPISSVKDAIPTGNFVHIHKQLWPQIFNTPAPEKLYGFCPIGVLTNFNL